MSAETIEWLNNNTLIGNTDKRGTAWHWRQGSENHYPGPVPMAAVESLIGGTTFTSEPLYIRPNEAPVAIPNRQAIVRDDTGEVFGIFKGGYKIHQYQEWLIDNVSILLDDPDLNVGSAGLLKRGGQAWVQVEMDETREVEGVEFRPFLTAATSVDGTLATTYKTGAQVVVCDNTLTAALTGQEGRVKVRHSANSLARIGDVRDALALVMAAGDAFAAQVEALTALTVSDGDWAAFVDAHSGLSGLSPEDGNRYTRASKKADALRNLYANDLRVAPWAGNAYGVLAAANTANQHIGSVRGTHRPERVQANFLHGVTEAADHDALATLARVTGLEVPTMA